MDLVRYFEPNRVAHRTCILSGADSSACRQHWRFWEADDKARAYLCGKCENVLIDPCPDEKALAEYYSNYSGHRLTDDKKNLDRKRQYVNDSQFVLREIQAGKLLDIGCSTGGFLSAFPSSFEKFGVDIDPTAISYARNHISGAQFDVLNLHEDISQDFDIVTMRGVIEHVLHPNDYIAYAARQLKPGGLLFICATPNLSSPVAHLYKSRWRLWHCVEHITIFSKRGLDKLCDSYGFNPTRFSFDYLDTPYASYQEDSAAMVRAITALQENVDFDEKSPPFFDAMLTCLYEKR